jgi:hypothetical protein
MCINKAGEVTWYLLGFVEAWARYREAFNGLKLLSGEEAESKKSIAKSIMYLAMALGMRRCDGDTQESGQANVVVVDRRTEITGQQGVSRFPGMRYSTRTASRSRWCYSSARS